MENCLVTKFKGSVSSNLPYYNSVLIQVNGNYSEDKDYTVSFTSVNGLKVIGSGSVLVDSTTTVTSEASLINGNHVFKFTPGNYQVLIKGKYGITNVGGPSGFPKQRGFNFDISQLNPCSLISIFMGGNALSGEFKPINTLTSVTSIGIARLNGSTINDYCINIEDMSECVNIGSIEVSFSKCRGSIETLHKLTQMSSFEATACASITGELRTLAAAMAPNKTNGSTLRITATGSNITDNGNRLTNAYIRGKGGTYNVIITFDSTAELGYTISYT